MINQEHIKIFSDAIKLYGPTNQFIICVEEIAELIKEISKMARTDNQYTEKDCLSIVDELADVYIMYYQLLILFDGSIESNTSNVLIFKNKQTILVNYLMFLMKIMNELSIFMFEEINQSEEGRLESKKILCDRINYAIRSHEKMIDIISNKKLVSAIIDFKMNRLKKRIHEAQEATQ